MEILEQDSEMNMRLLTVKRIASELDALEAAGQIESWSWVGVRPSRWRYTWYREWARSWCHE